MSLIVLYLVPSLFEAVKYDPPAGTCYLEPKASRAERHCV